MVQQQQKAAKQQGSDAVVPLRVGKLLTLVRLTYQRSWDPTEGAYSSRAFLGIRVAGPSPFEYQGCGKAREGTITAGEHALRDALKKAGIALPTTELIAFSINVAAGKTGPEAPAAAEATVRLGTWERFVRVDEADGTTAGILLIFDAYDYLLMERWRTNLAPAGMTPELALANMAEDDDSCGAFSA